MVEEGRVMREVESSSKKHYVADQLMPLSISAVEQCFG